jgi:hypothetical protein
MKSSEKEYSWSIEQGGIVVAEGSGFDVETVKREMVHYAVQYAQDGPIRIKGSPELKPAGY